MNILSGIFLSFVIRTCFFAHLVLTECIYENTRYSEGSLVPTAEPCLRCVCARNTLLCYLRVCPELPDPPPSGCLILHRHRTCCPELVCADMPSHNRIEARYEPDLPELSHTHSVGSGCIHNGTIYGSGSAMQTSSLCEYCYCINGKERCVKPKCLLPVEGCKASYAPHSCCPTHYKCRGDGYKRIKSTTTTIAAPVDSDARGGCIVSGQRYVEGGKILGIGHSPCDNCYCMRGVVRCVPLQCAPPLLGCTPVVPVGECCAASYNCSGVIEVQPNYGPKPLVSKDYSHIRKEVQQTSYNQPRKNPSTPHYILPESFHSETINLSNINHYKSTHTIPKSSTPYYFTSTPKTTLSTLIPTSRQFFATTKHLPLDSKLSTPESSSKYSKISLTTTRITGSGNNTKNESNTHQDSSNIRPIFKPSQLISITTENGEISPVYNSQDKPYIATTTKRLETYSSLISKRKDETSTPKILKYANYVDIDFANDLFLDGRNNRRIDDQQKSETTAEMDNITTITDITTTDFTTETTTDFETTTTENISTSTVLDTTTYQNDNITTDELSTNNLMNLTTIRSNINITGTEIIGNNTECIDSTSNELPLKLENRIDVYQPESTTEDFTTTTLISTIDDITSTESPTTLDISEAETSPKTGSSNISATVLPFKKISPDIEAILNITKTIDKEDYEYDYNEPSLPPSLPNLKIIPFVAADAVVEEKESATVPYVNSHVQENLREIDNPHYGYTEGYNLNLFSPPIETEGGFVPRDPPILNNFYENGYHTTGIVDITAGTGVPAITNPPKTNDDNCIVEGREVRHGELTSELGACSVCLCLFGDIVCQPPKCPQVPPGCRRTQPMSSPPVCCGHVVCNGNEESPTVVLDRIDVTSNPEDDPQSDPFRDVIRTEPAPDLQSLIGDIMPYLVHQTSTLKSTSHMTTPKISSTTETHFTTQELHKNSQNNNEMSPEMKLEEEHDFSLESVFKLLFNNENNEKTTTKFNKPTNDPPISTSTTKMDSISTINSQLENTKYPVSNSWYLSTKTQNENENPSKNSIDGSSSVGLLKLAGCNIYGRMYRVGRIISELSGPCLECMCTEIGVQCRPLNC